MENYLKESFGSLTVIKDNKTGLLYFIGKQVADQWGHTNLTQAIKSARLDRHEHKKIILSELPQLKLELTNLGLVTPKTPWLTLITEPGLYRLALASNLKKARPLYDWVVADVLPSIRQTGKYFIPDEKAINAPLLIINCDNLLT